jgi:hypothetical protein
MAWHLRYTPGKEELQMPRSANVVEQFDGESRPMSPTETAYLAGLIDGEGTISVYARRGKANLSHILNEHVSIVNTNLTIIRHAARLLGGTIYRRDRGGENRTCYTLPFDGQRAIVVAAAVREFLIGKRQQADLLLELAAIREQRRTTNWVDYSDADLEEMSRIVNTIAAANGAKRSVITITLLRPQKRAPGAPQGWCEVESCSERVQIGCGGMCLAHFREMQALIHTQRCEWCDNEYQSQRTDQRFCSPKCQWQAGRLRREGKGERRVFACPVCLKPVITTDPRKLTCGSQCYSKMKYRERKESGYFETRRSQE